LSLKGKTVAITRPIEQTQDLADLIIALGGEPYVVPTVEIQPVKSSLQINQFIDKIVDGTVGLVVFMSQNAVTSLFEASSNMGLRAKLFSALGGVRIVTVGPRTRKTLETCGLTAVATPSNYSSDGIIGEIDKLSLKGKVVAIPRTDKASDYFKTELEKRSIGIFEFTVYETVLPLDKSKVNGLLQDLLRQKVDVITFTSSSTAQNLFDIAKEHHLQNEVRKALNEKVIVVSIGPVTRKTLEDLGVEVDVMPNRFTIEDMVIALDDYFSQCASLEDLDTIDKKLLQQLQDNYPLVERPWEKIGSTLQIGEDAAIARSRRLFELGIIREIGPILDKEKIGFAASTLIGLKVPDNKVAEVAQVINQYSNVSHNYLREHEYNVWFTLTASSISDIETTLKEIKQKCALGDDDILNLPTKRRFKIDVRFQFINEAMKRGGCRIGFR
jgi:uroporphyrinogen-III synthase/DNA-binding Lrp family transcriptional regulator